MCRTTRTWHVLVGVLTTLCIMLLTGGIGASTAQAQATPWPAPPAGVTVDGCSYGLGLDPLGNLFTADYGCTTTFGGPISKISTASDGTVTVNADWTKSYLNYPEWVTVDDTGHVITVGDYGDVAKYLPEGPNTPSGTLDPSFADGGVLTLDGKPNVYDVVTDHAGNIFTANYGNGTVSKISPTGIVDWTAYASGDRDYGTYSVAVDEMGNVYASNDEEGTLWKLLPDGTPASGAWPVTVGAAPDFITIDAQGNVYVPNYDDGTVSKILPDGTTPTSGPWAAVHSEGMFPGVYVGGNPIVVTIDAMGSLYVTNHVDEGYVSKILSDGTLVEDGWPQATGSAPWGAVIDSTGNLFVTNFRSRTITKFAGVAAPAPPIAPDAPSAVAGAESATVTITLNAVTAQHGTPTSYTITTVEDASKTCTMTMPATSCVVDHLTGGKAYTFTAKANLVTWQTGASAASTAVTPTATPVVVMKATPLVITLKDNQVGAQSNSVTISFTADGPGSASLNGSTGGQRASNGSVKVCSAKKTIKKAGKVTMTCTLNNKGKALRTQHALHVVLTLTFTPTGGTTTSATKNATFARTKATKPKPSTTPSNVTG